MAKKTKVEVEEPQSNHEEVHVEQVEKPVAKKQEPKNSWEIKDRVYYCLLYTSDAADE